MNNVTIVWSMIASCALLLAAMHAIVWIMDRKALANLSLAGVGFSVVGMALIELALMRSTTTAQWSEWARWMQVPVFLLLVSVVLFVRFYMKTGRDWLMWTIFAMRVAVLVWNFLVDPSFNFKSVEQIERVTFLGEQISVTKHVVAGSRQWLGSLSTLLVLVYMGDALVTLWRTGTRAARNAAILFGSTIFISTTLASAFAHYLIWGDAQMPVLLSPPFLILLCAMAFELSRDTLRAPRLVRELGESEARLEFAAGSAGLGLWSWTARPNRIWATQRVHEMFGIADGDSLTAERLQPLLHADDVPHVQDVLREAAVTGTVQEVRFRICSADGAERWILARGRSDANEGGVLTSIQGVLRDVTDQFQAQEENDELRRELAHVERAAVLGKLSSSIAHELSQPLAAILHNAETAEILLNGPTPNLAELREIVADIQRDDLRAGDVISGLRALFTRREISFVQLSVDSLVQVVVSLLRADARERMVTIDSAIEPGTPDVRGDRVHVSQVLINLFLNAMDAVADRPAGQKRVKVTARAVDSGWVEISVSDTGPGIADDVMKRIFDPFFTTKPGGMGMGLSVSRTIVEAHRGKLRAENAVTGGATFRVTLPVFETTPVS